MRGFSGRSTHTPTRPELSGRSLREAAHEAGLHAVDLLCDQVIADDLATLVDVPVLNRSQEGALTFLDDESIRLFKRSGAVLVPTLMPGHRIPQTMEGNPFFTDNIREKANAAAAASRFSRPDSEVGAENLKVPELSTAAFAA